MNVFERIAARATGKSLVDQHPEILEREPLLRLNSEEESLANPESGFGKALQDYQGQAWVHKAVKILSDNLTPLPVKVVRGEGSDMEFISHPLQKLLSNPNPEQSPADFWRSWCTDMMLGGEWGIEVSWNKAQNTPIEFWGKQTTEYTITAESKRYHRVKFYTIKDNLGDPYNLLPNQFIHLKFYNPANTWRGLAPITAIRMSIIIDQLAQVWTRLFFKNQARPDYAVIAPEGVTKTEREELEKQLTARFSSNGTHRPIILESGVTDIKTFSFPPKDLEWVQQRELSRDEIAAIFGVPDEIMGFGKDTYENFDAADRVLWTLTIVPLCDLRDGTLTRFFRRYGLLKPDESIKTDMSGVSQLQENISGKITSGKTLFDMGVPVNVINQTLGLKLPEIPGGDVGYLNSSMVPVTMLPIISPVATPPLAAPKSIKRKNIPSYGSAEHETLWKRLIARTDAPTTELQRLVKREFQRQQNEVGRKLREGKTYGRGMFKENKPPTPEELFDLEEEIELFKVAFKDSVTGQVQTVGQDTLNRLGISGVFDLNRPEVQRAIAGILNAVSEKTNETTWNDLISLFEEAEVNGEGIVAIQERLSTYFGDRKSDYQTERIARTTTNGAANAGSYQAALQAEQDGVNLERVWISALQAGRTRQAHWEAHGQTVGLHEPFSVDGESLMYPGDPTGSPGNIINCFCISVEQVVEE